MICRNCETENTEGSIFCKSCGFRLDGKKKCPACDSLNDEGNIYCNQCGTRIDGKKICSNCGGEIVGVFCSKCGTRYGNKNVQTYNKIEQPSTTSYVGKILDIVGSSVLMLCAVLSLIFIFFVGLVIEESNQEISTFYFFGKAFKEIKSLLLAVGKYSASFETGIYIIFVTCTAFIGISMLCCLIFTTLAIVTFVKKLCFGGEKSSALFSLLSVIFYFVCATTIRSVFYMKIIGLDDSILDIFDINLDINTTYFKFNSITKTGLLLVLLFLLMYVVLEITKKLLTINKTKIVGFVFAMINVVLSIVLVVVLYNSTLKFGDMNEDGMEMFISFSWWSAALAMLNIKIEILNIVIFGGIIQLIIALVIFLASFSLAKSISQEKNNIAFSICIFIFLLIALVLQFVVINETFDYINKILEIAEIEVVINENNSKISCTPIIVSFIISFISLITNIIYSVLNAKTKSINNAEIERVMF